MGIKTSMAIIPIYIAPIALISPLGNDLEDHKIALAKNLSGIATQPKVGFGDENWPQAKINTLPEKNRFDHLLNIGLDKIAEKFESSLLEHESTLVIISSTKGNLDLLPLNPFDGIFEMVKTKWNLKHQPILISNACISGVVAIQKAADYLRFQKFHQVIVLGIDVLSDFVTYGFQSLFALSDEPCKPYDHNRKGINLGEAFGAVLLTKDANQSNIVFHQAITSNDANHISGPSRTGEGLYRSIRKLFEVTGVKASDIAFISAHGTATLYNDDMESQAFHRSELTNTPTFSLKGYFGHTLGAAGVIETIASLFCLQDGIAYKSLGFEEEGTTCAMHICRENTKTTSKFALKTASGFGGGNAALLMEIKS